MFSNKIEQQKDSDNMFVTRKKGYTKVMPLSTSNSTRILGESLRPCHNVHASFVAHPTPCRNFSNIA